jgi:tripartite-type tricarboxylate transporter receptor subunit TctC
LLHLLSATAQAETGFPVRPIRLVVPASAGGEPDILARLVARQMSVDLRQPIVVENKVGASGLIGVARSQTRNLTDTPSASFYQAALRCRLTLSPRDSLTRLPTSP